MTLDISKEDNVSVIMTVIVINNTASLGTCSMFLRLPPADLGGATCSGAAERWRRQWQDLPLPLPVRPPSAAFQMAGQGKYGSLSAERACWMKHTLPIPLERSPKLLLSRRVDQTPPDGDEWYL